MNNIICVKVNCYKGFSYEETLDGIKNAGFKYLELSTSKGNSLNMSQDMDDDMLNKLINDLAIRDLKAIAIGGNSYLMDDDTSKIIKNIELAHKLGCKYIDTTVYNARNDGESYTSDEDVVAHIKPYLPYLEKYNLDLVIELHGLYATGDKLVNILNLVNSKHVHINYDTGNTLFWGKLKVDEMIDDYNRCKSYVTYMHLKDKLGSLEEWNFPAIGKGYIPFDRILKDSNNITLCAEIEFTEKGVSSIEEVNEALVDSYSYLSNLYV